MCVRVVSSLYLIYPEQGNREAYLFDEELSTSMTLTNTKYEWGGGEGGLLGSLDKVLKSRRLMYWLKKINETSDDELRLHLVLSRA